MRQLMRCRDILLCLTLVGSLVLMTYLPLSIPRQTTTVPHRDMKDTIKQGSMIYNDSQLVDYVKSHVLIVPSGRHRLLNSSNSTTYSQLDQDKLVDELLKGRRNGFFVEAGAYDGEQMSNTLFLERARNWTGLLIEGNPKLFETLQARHRNVYISNACLSTSIYAAEVNFTFADYLSGQGTPGDKSLITGQGPVQCFPLMTYLLALNISHVDYFSLDIEGGEFDVLKQIDFRRIQIDVLTIEYAIKYHRSPESLENLKHIDELLIGTGLYRQVKTISDLDVVFIRKSL